jgi:ring-1,2-phenylacetyl-CoA epoxidase subunit PaaD
VVSVAEARAVAGAVTDPELPQVTLDELGVLGDVTDEGGTVVVALTPTYLGCPALDAMRDGVVAALHGAGYDDVEVRLLLSPPWSSDRISAAGRRKLAAAGIAPPGPAVRRPPGDPIPLVLRPAPADVSCPRCASVATEQTSPFGATACMSLHRCRRCGEPFQHFKAH